MKVLLISDIHGNYDALRAVLESATGHDEVWVLGDLVDYGPEPEAVVDAVRELSPRVVVRGNHDHAAAFGVDCFCGPELLHLSTRTREEVTMKRLGSEQRSWLGSLDLQKHLAVGSVEAVIVHGSPRSPLYGYLKPDMTPELLAGELAPAGRLGMRAREPGLQTGGGLVIAGHTHIPADIRIGGFRVLNPGSVGQPRDGDPRASYGVLDTETLEFRVYRVEYDVSSVVSKLRSVVADDGVFEELARVLLTGRPPSREPARAEHGGAPTRKLPPDSGQACGEDS